MRLQEYPEQVIYRKIYKGSDLAKSDKVGQPTWCWCWDTEGPCRQCAKKYYKPSKNEKNKSF